jgi:hypothetical protein
MDKDQEYHLRQLQNARNALAKSLPEIIGMPGNGVEARYVAAVQAEYDYRELLGESGIMRGKRKYQRR